MNIEKNLKRVNPLYLGLITIIIVCSLVYWLALVPPNALSRNVDEKLFSAYRAIDIIHNVLSNNKPHPVNSIENIHVRDNIINILKQYGYQPKIQKKKICKSEHGFVTCMVVENIIAIRLGESNKAIMLAAHYDSLGAGVGASDNGSGVGVILEIARIFKQKKLKNSLILLFSDAEEEGLMGATAFVKELPVEQDIAVVLNLETRGTTGMSVMFETSSNNHWLIEILSKALKNPVANSAFYEAYKLMPNSTDFAIFKKQGIAGLNFAYADYVSRYHTSNDSLEYLDSSSIQHHGDNIHSMTSVLLDMELSNKSNLDASYIDIFSEKIVYWPKSYSLYLSISSLLVVLLSVLNFYRANLIRVKEILWSSTTILLYSITVSLSGFLLMYLLSFIHNTSIVWFSYGKPIAAMLWFLSFMLMFIFSKQLSSRVSVHALISSIWIIYSLITIIISVVLPGVEPIFIVTLIPASIILFIISIVKENKYFLSLNYLVILQSLIMALFWFPLSVIMIIMFGYSTGLAVVIPSIFILLPIWHLLSTSSIKLRIPILVFIFSLSITFFIPIFTHDSQQPLNFVHVSNIDTGSKLLMLESPMTKPPQYILQNNYNRVEHIIPWNKDSIYWASQSNISTGLAPKLTLLKRKIIGESQELTFEIKSLRNAYVMILHIPESAKVNTILISDTGKYLKFDTPRNGQNAFICVGIACNGQKFTISLPISGPVNYVLEDISIGLEQYIMDVEKFHGDFTAAYFVGDRSKIFKTYIY